MAARPMDPFDHSHEPSEWRRDDAPPAPARPPYRPPIGVPLQRPSRWAGPLSLVFHALILLAILLPVLGSRVLPTIIQGAGGPGAAGGGGGGRNGSGGSEHVVERLRYIQTAPPPAPASVPNPLKPPVPKPPVEEKKPDPPKQPPKVEAKVDQPAPTDVALTAGTGGGTGNDGTNGTGPGTGGGVGSGVGTGRGSGNGPGTGGGPGDIYPPSPDFVPIPPFPVPSKVRGDSVQLRFMVDERGNVLKLEFDPTRDGGYNKKIREQFSLVRFRPATKDGNPVASPAVVTLFFH